MIPVLILYLESGKLRFSLPFHQYVSTSTWRKFLQAEEFFHSSAIEVVEDAIQRYQDAIEQNNMEEMDFYLLSCFLSQPDLTLKDVIILCLSLFTDGLNTTTPTILFNLYALATNAHSQEMAYQEIQKVIRKDDEMITADHINKMSYLKAFVKETFRLFPIATELSRYTVKPMNFLGYEIPIGTHLDFNATVHFKNPEIFYNPDKHEPEVGSEIRWIKYIPTYCCLSVVAPECALGEDLQSKISTSYWLRY